MLKCNNCWHINNYGQENSILGINEHKKAEFLDIFLFVGELKIQCSAELSMEKVSNLGDCIANSCWEYAVLNLLHNASHIKKIKINNTVIYKYTGNSRFVKVETHPKPQISQRKISAPENIL